MMVIDETVRKKEAEGVNLVVVEGESHKETHTKKQLTYSNYNHPSPLVPGIPLPIEYGPHQHDRDDLD